MEKPTFAFYAVPGPDGLPRVAHMIVGTQPADAVEITEGHAQQISADVRAREEKTVEAAPVGYVSRAEAQEIADRAVRAFAAEIAKSAGGGG